MSNAIIPEIIRRDIRKETNSKTLNINLNNNIDKRQQYNVDHRSYTTNNTTNNIQKGGFLRFIFDAITFPIRLIYSGVKHVYIKYDIKNKIKADMEKAKKAKWVKKYLNNSKDIYDLEEIY